MFTDQINILTEQEKDLYDIISEAQAKLDDAYTKAGLIKKAKKALEKLQEQFDGQTAVSDQ